MAEYSATYKITWTHPKEKFISSIYEDGVEEEVESIKNSLLDAVGYPDDLDITVEKISEAT